MADEPKKGHQHFDSNFRKKWMMSKKGHQHFDSKLRKKWVMSKIKKLNNKIK